MSRALGRIRDADVRIELLRCIEPRMPAIAGSVVRLRQRQEADRLRLVRKLVKFLEKLRIEKELARWSPARPWPLSLSWLVASGAWRNQIRHRLAEHAEDSADAITHATKVYFPNRAHRARIALKKFRYAAEIASETAIPTGKDLLRTLKKGQDVLGGLHDRQALLDDVRDVIESRSKDDDEIPDLRSIVQFVEAEIGDLHRRFVARRDKILEAAEDARKAMRRSQMPAAAIAVAAAVACAGVYAIRKSTRADGRPEGLPAATPAPVSLSPVSVRVPVIVAFGSER
jgi:CHAD domain-containing protein